MKFINYQLAIVLLLASTGLLSAQNPTSLLTDFGTPDHQLTEQAKRQRSAALRLSPAQLTDGTTLQLNLFADVTYTVELEARPRQHVVGDVDLYWGSTKDPAWAHLPHYRDVILAANRTTGKLIVYASTSAGFFVVEPVTGTDRYRIYEANEPEWSAATCGEERLKGNDLLTEKTVPTGSCAEQDENGVYVVDMLFTYSHQAEAAAGDVVAHAVAQAETVNQGLANSLITNTRIRVVDIAVTDNFTGIVSSALGANLTLYADRMAAVGADMLADFQTPNPAVDNAGGWGQVPGRSCNNSVTGATVFRHEWGHNTGSSHCTPSVTPWGSGYANSNGTRTHLCGNNVNFYSNPRIDDADGFPLGDASNADNARAITEQRGRVMANYAVHVIPYQVVDDGTCPADLLAGAYHIRNVASSNYLSPSGNGGQGQMLVQSTTNTDTEDIWEVHHIGDGRTQLYNRNRNTTIDRFGQSNSIGDNVGVWNHDNLQGNQTWFVTATDNGNFLIESTSSSNVLGITNGESTDGDGIGQRENDGSTDVEWLFIPVAVTPAVVDISSTATATDCPSAGDGAVDLTVTGGTAPYTYEWADGAATEDRAGLTSGEYTVTVTEDGRRYHYISAVRTTAPMIPEVAVTRSTPSAGGTITITNVQNTTATLTYAWSDGGPNSATRTGLAAGDYTVTISEPNGCQIEREIRVVETIDVGDYVIQHVPTGLYLENEGSEVILGDCPTDNEQYRWTAVDEGGTVVKFRNNNGLMLTVFGRTMSGAQYYTGGDGDVSPHKHALVSAGNGTWTMRNQFQNFFTGVDQDVLGGALIHEELTDVSQADAFRFIPIVDCTPVTTSACDDGLNSTDNDIVNLLCDCCGVPNVCFVDRNTEGNTDGDIDCDDVDCDLNDATVFRGSFCDDGDATNFGDALDENCDCLGRPETCTETGADLQNIAPFGTAFVSDMLSNPNTADAASLIDGLTNGNFPDGGVWHSDGSAGSYAELDLGQLYPVREVVIHNRTDCCTDRLADAFILVSDTPFSSGSLATARAEADFEFQVSSTYDSDLPLVISPEVLGRYVRVQRSTGVINIAEIEARTCPQQQAALPVDLLSFSGEAVGKFNVLRWATATETGNRGFMLERALEAGNFAPLAWTEAAGNSTDTRHYEHTDTDPLPGTSYYRLRQVDLDGTEALSNVVRIDRTDGNEWSVFPNPADQRELLRIRSATPTTFTLFDLRGRLLQTTATPAAGFAEVRMSVRDLPAGVYVLRHDENGSVRRVVVR